MNSSTMLKQLCPPSGKTGWPWTEESKHLPPLMPNNKPWPKISIVTPSYNQGQFLEETIRSVLLQNYPNLEYIIIDGGSTDNSVEIIKKYEPWLTYWVSEKDEGQADAINKGYRRATGDVINWLNSDDYYETGALFKVALAFSEPGVNVFCATSRVFGEGKEYYSNGTDIYPGNLEKTIGWARIDQPETFFKKSVWDKLGGIDPRFHYIMDKEFWIRYLFVYGLNGIVKSKDLLVHFRLHENSKTISQNGGFRTELFILFYSIASGLGFSELATYIRTNYDPELLNLNYNCTHGDTNKVLNYFIYHQMAEAYAMNNKTRLRSFRQIIDKNALEAVDRKKCKEIELRSQFIPIALKKWWNKL